MTFDDLAIDAACDPDTIRALLDERDALAAENARLRQALEALESGAWDTMRGRNAIAAIRERLGIEELK